MGLPGFKMCARPKNLARSVTGSIPLAAIIGASGASVNRQRDAAPAAAIP
jgi:hypothetical protein